MIHLRRLARRNSLLKGLPGLVIAASLLASCGGGSPGGPNPLPSDPPGTPVTTFVFYDENANGIADPHETIRLPGVTVQIASRTGQTAIGGRAVVANVPSGAQAATVRAESLPAYFVPGAQVSVQVPAGAEVAVPATLAIGTNRTNVYMAFGDSITFGEGSNDGSGYRSYLEADLRTYWGGTASVRNEGVSATRSNRGAQRIGVSLDRTRPAYSLILYGTNDWNDIECRDERFPCYTVESLRSMIREARSIQSNPILGTIIPVNPEFADRDPATRNDWVRRMNEQIRAMARTERVAVADIHAAYLRQPSLISLYRDYLHPNEQGFALMAQEFLRGITQPLSVSTAGGRPFFFSLGGR
jgi:lysophospholipase L1-like esterase